MKRFVTYAALLILAATLSPTAATAGPWVKEPGKTYLKVAGEVFSGGKTYDLEGQKTDPAYDYSHRALRLYGELGILPRIGFGFSLPVLHARNVVDRTKYAKSGLGDLDLWLGVQIHRDPCAVSGKFRTRVPLYDDILSSDAEPSVRSPGAAGQARYMPALGDGSIDLAPTLAAGCPIPGVGGWVSAEVGPRFRLNGFGHGIEYAADVGAFVWPERLAITARVGGIQTLSQENERPTKSYLSIYGGLYLLIWEGLGLEAGASTIPTGRFVASGWSATAGISYDGRLFANPFSKN